MKKLIATIFCLLICACSSPQVLPTPVALSSEKVITVFSVNGVDGTIDEQGKTITAILPTGTVITGLTPAITFIGQSINPLSGEAKDFTNPVIYTVTADDLTTQDYTATVSVIPAPIPEPIPTPIPPPASKPATALKISMIPDTPGHPVGTYCTATRKITGNIDITDSDGNTNLSWEWYDNGEILASGQTVVPEINGHYTTTFYGTPTPPEPFQWHHTVMFKVTADGVTSSLSAYIV